MSNEEEYLIPIFFINGQLESGKTTFIQGIIAGGQFDAAKKKLLVAFEDGEVEYDKQLLDEHGIDLVILSPSEMTSEKMAALDDKYDPWLVIVEYNGMVDPKQFRDLAMPHGWQVYQSITIMNAETFQNQWKNMKSIMAESVKAAESVVFNRCTEEMELGSFKRSMKALNPNIDIIFEDVSGNIISGTNDTVPYDMEADVIEVSDNDFGVWFIDCRDRPKAYDGRVVRFKAQALRDPELKENEFVASRQVMTCCEDDIALVGYIVKKTDVITDPSYPAEKEWVMITAEITYEERDEYNGMGPVLVAETIETTEKPKMEKRAERLNSLLVQLFNDILHIEEKVLKSSEIKDLSITEIHTIDAIGTQGNRTMGEIAHDLRITVGTLTSAINRLIKKGYAERSRTEEDRRVVLVSLTEKGKHAYKIHADFHKEMVQATLNSYNDEEQEVLCDVIEKINIFFEDKYEGLQ